ncbi:MAG: hypothetical protein AB1938_24430 [Myxococcota bacterium]
MRRAALLGVVLFCLAARGEKEHPAYARGLWIQITPLDLSYTAQSVQQLSFLPWVPLTLGGDVGLFSAGIGFGLRPLVRGLLVSMSPVARLHIPLEASLAALLFEARFHVGVATQSGLVGGGGLLVGVDFFVWNFVSLSPGLGVDLLGGAFGGTLPSGIAFVLSGRMGVNFVW